LDKERLEFGSSNSKTSSIINESVNSKTFLAPKESEPIPGFLKAISVLETLDKG